MPSLLDSLEQVASVKTNLANAEKQLDSLEAKIEEKRKELKELTTKSEQISHKTLEEAQQQARLVLKEAETIRDKVQQSLAQAQAQEKATVWVVAEDQRLKVLQQDLVKQQAKLSQEQSNVSALRDLYTSKLKELTDREEAVAKREQGLPGTPPGKLKLVKKTV